MRHLLHPVSVYHRHNLTAGCAPGGLSLLCLVGAHLWSGLPLQEFYETTLQALQKSRNDRLWFKTNLKLCNLWFKMAEWGRMAKTLKELHRWGMGGKMEWVLGAWGLEVDGVGWGGVAWGGGRWEPGGPGRERDRHCFRGSGDEGERSGAGALTGAAPAHVLRQRGWWAFVSLSRLLFLPTSTHPNHIPAPFSPLPLLSSLPPSPLPSRPPAPPSCSPPPPPTHTPGPASWRTAAWT
jgi:hypothetical protein